MSYTASDEVKWPSKEDVEQGVDPWELLPNLDQEQLHGKLVRVTIEVVNEEPKHIFVTLVALQDLITTIPQEARKHVERIFDYMWADELRHYWEENADELGDAGDDSVIAHARGQLR